jgi:hypothetical protein
LNCFTAFRPAVALFLLLSLVPVLSAAAQTLVSHYETTSFTAGIPEDTGSSWTRVGTGHVLLMEEGELLINDNSPGTVVAYQGLLGRIEASHDVVFRGELKVLSNIGGEAALIEISRPGMELLVQLHPDRITVVERSSREPGRWLGSAPVDLTDFREIEIHKSSDAGSGPERLTVSVGGNELITVSPRGTGDMGLGRVLFGSLGYSDLGATIWRWVEVQAVYEEQKTPTTAATVGQLKARFQY